MTCSDVTLCSWNSPPLFAGKTGLSLQICVRQTLRLTTELVDWCRNVRPRHQPLTRYLKQRLIDTRASISQNVIDEAVGQWRKRLRASMKVKWHHFEHLLKLKPALFRAYTLHNRLFSEPPTVYRGIHVVTRHFHRRYLKANKVNKLEGTRKVEHAYHFRKCHDAVYQK